MDPENAAIQFMIEEWGDPGAIPQIAPCLRGKVGSELAQTVVALNKRTKPYMNRKHCFLKTFKRDFPRIWRKYRKKSYKEMMEMENATISRIWKLSEKKYDEAWGLRRALDEIDQEILFGSPIIPIIGGCLGQEIEDRDSHQNQGHIIQ